MAQWGKMDYTDLKITERQIRLITILPPSPTDPTGPVRCTMTVRSQSLPTSEQAPSTTGPLPPNYISFDHWVTTLPEESHVEELRNLLAPALESIDKKQSSVTTRVVSKVLKKALNQELELAVTIPVRTIIDMLTGEEKVRIVTSMGETSRTDGFNRRVPMSENRFIQATEDEAGHALYYGRMTPAWGDYVGTLPAAEVNPFFRPPETSTRKGKKMKRQADDNYVAMSYWWGPKDEEPTAEIVVNGRIVKVRENLEAGLRQFREMEYFQQGGKIWIDSLCINQQDEAEKQDQVQMMASIYRCAGNVMVWLGPADIESGCSITFLENAGADFRAEYVEAFDGADPITAHTWRTMALVRMETSYNRFSDELRTEPTRLLDPRQELLDDVAFAFHSFFARPYWRRLWIIQELCMGRGGMPIVCGDRVTQWRYIRDGVLKFMSILDILDERRRGSSSLDKRASLQESLSHVAQIAQLEIMGHRRKIQHVDDNRLPLIAPTWLEHGPLLGSALRRAVVLASRTDCSRSHDRIYGMLSIPPIPDLGIKVDYTKPLADVFTEFSAACVKHGSLDFFAILDGGRMSLTDEHGNPQDPDKPSWVPDYGAKPERRIGILDGVWHAGGYVPVSFAQPVVGPQNFLCCQGKVVDTVDGTGAISQADVESGAMIFKPEDDLLSLQQPTVPDSESENQNPQLRGEAVIYNVLVGGCDRNGMEAPVSFKCLYTAFPSQQPLKYSSFYRNWHFLNSSAGLMVHGRPLSSYFGHMAAPVSDTTEPDSASTPAYTMSGASETAAARQAMEMRTKMRRLIVTKAGYLGLAPVQTRPGDVVIDIVGHPTPLIARKDGTMDGQDFWYLIGEAYIAGLMGAEKMPLSTKHWHQKETRRAMAEMDIIIFV